MKSILKYIIVSKERTEIQVLFMVLGPVGGIANKSERRKIRVYHRERLLLGTDTRG